MKQIQFKGKGQEYFKIWIVNLLLCIVTLGIYYPWAKVRTRRYFYANTEYANRFFDYHATGKQLFLGYLIGVGILITLQIIASIFPMAGFILPVIIFIFLPWIIWRSLKFNMRMTSFSNVRFSFAGDLKTSYIVHLLIPVLGYAVAALIIFGGISLVGDPENINPSSSNIILMLLALIVGIGLAVYVTGLFNQKAAEYQIGEAKFGQGKFFINIGARKFITIALKATLINIGFILLFMIIFGLMLASTSAGGFDVENMASGADLQNMSSMLVVTLMMMYFGLIAAFLFSSAYAYSRKRSYLFDNTTLDKEIGFKSTVSARGYFIVLLSNMLLVIFTLGLATPWAKVRVAEYVAKNTWIEANDNDINRYLTQKEKEQSAIGEEIGDVLDLDIDIAI